MKNKHEKEQNDAEVRLDKWLWAARFYKTRSIAKAMIEGVKSIIMGKELKLAKRWRSVPSSNFAKAMKKKRWKC